MRLKLTYSDPVFCVWPRVGLCSRLIFCPPGLCACSPTGRRRGQLWSASGEVARADPGGRGRIWRPGEDCGQAGGDWRRWPGLTTSGKYKERSSPVPHCQAVRFTLLMICLARSDRGLCEEDLTRAPCCPHLALSCSHSGQLASMENIIN